MSLENIEIEYLPKLNNPIFIAGFEGWGNALDISIGMTNYLIKKLNAKYFCKINPTSFYKTSIERPITAITDGKMEELTFTGGEFFYADMSNIGENDLVIFRAIEPHFRWSQFIDNILTLSNTLESKTFISLGSMFDNVLHSDTVISFITSNKEMRTKLAEYGIIPVDYNGPSSIHSSLQMEAQKRGLECMSLWSHCPYYLEGTTHFALLSSLVTILSNMCRFSIDTEELNLIWLEVSKQIKKIIKDSPEIEEMINDIKKNRIKKSWGGTKKGDKIIRLEDFINTN